MADEDLPVDPIGLALTLVKLLDILGQVAEGHLGKRRRKMSPGLRRTKKCDSQLSLKMEIDLLSLRLNKEAYFGMHQLFPEVAQGNKCILMHLENHPLVPLVLDVADLGVGGRGRVRRLEGSIISVGVQW